MRLYLYKIHFDKKKMNEKLKNNILIVVGSNSRLKICFRTANSTLIDLNQKPFYRNKSSIVKNDGKT